MAANSARSLFTVLLVLLPLCIGSKVTYGTGKGTGDQTDKEYAPKICQEAYSLTLKDRSRLISNTTTFMNKSNCESNKCFSINSAWDSPSVGQITGCVDLTMRVFNKIYYSLQIKSSDCGTSGTISFGADNFTYTKIHCTTIDTSLDQNTTSTSKVPWCFSAHNLVATKNRGLVRISELRTGDYVKAYDTERGDEIFSRFLAYSHYDPLVRTNYLIIRTKREQKALTLSHYHLILTLDGNSTKFIFAWMLKKGDVLVLAEDKKDTVESVNQVLDESGAFAPLTESGTIIVNDIVASCYANFRSQRVAHVVMPLLTRWSQLINNWLFHYKDTTEMATNLGIFSFIKELFERLPFLSDAFIQL